MFLKSILMVIIFVLSVGLSLGGLCIKNFLLGILIFVRGRLCIVLVGVDVFVLGRILLMMRCLFLEFCIFGCLNLVLRFVCVWEY